MLARATGAETDRGGRIKVNPDLTVPGHPEISVIGDIASLEGPGGRPLPGLATVAIQQAAPRREGDQARAAGATKPFQLPRQGRPGRHREGPGDLRDPGLKLSGRLALATYLGVHLFYLGGEGKRLKLLIDWITTRFGDRGNQVIQGELSSVERAPPREAAPR